MTIKFETAFDKDIDRTTEAKVAGALASIRQVRFRNIVLIGNALPKRNQPSRKEPRKIDAIVYVTTSSEMKDDIEEFLHQGVVLGKDVVSFTFRDRRNPDSPYFINLLSDRAVRKEHEDFARIITALAHEFFGIVAPFKRLTGRLIKTRIDALPPAESQVYYETIATAATVDFLEEMLSQIGPTLSIRTVTELGQSLNFQKALYRQWQERGRQLNIDPSLLAAADVLKFTPACNEMLKRPNPE